LFLFVLVEDAFLRPTLATTTCDQKRNAGHTSISTSLYIAIMKAATTATRPAATMLALTSAAAPAAGVAVAVAIGEIVLVALFWIFNWEEVDLRLGPGTVGVGVSVPWFRGPV
jgi:hypothetical protein